MVPSSPSRAGLGRWKRKGAYQEIDIFHSPDAGAPSDKQGKVWRFTSAKSATIAEAMGALGIRPAKRGELRPALDPALAVNRPAVVEVISNIPALAHVCWRARSIALA